MLGLEQIINPPTYITYKNTSLIDYTLASIIHQLHSMVLLMLMYLNINLSTVKELIES